MPEFFNCVVLEWGVGFIGLLVGALVLGLIIIIGAGWYFGLRPPKKGGGTIRVKWKKAWEGAVSGSPATFIVYVVSAVALLGLAGYGVKYVYDNYKETYSVAWNSPDGNTLEHIRSKLQSETRASIILQGDVGKQIVKGRYVAPCVAELFAHFCRQYSSQIECETSSFHSQVTVRSKKSP